MKTSNKMLIGIAIALFVIPISTMVFSSLNGRVDYGEYNRGIAAEGADLNTEDRFLSTTKLKEFKDIKFVSPSYAYLRLHLVKSNEYGVKTNRSNSSNLSYEVDENGTLLITLQNGSSHGPAIYIYAPDINHIEFDKVELGELRTEQDSLSLVLSNYRNRQETVITENLNLDFLHLSLNDAEWTMRGSSQMFAQLETLDIKLNNSKISLKSDHYNRVLVNAKNSFFQISPAKGKNTTVGALNVNTLGKSTVALEERVRIDSLSGVISDSTFVKLPYYMMGGLASR